mgnify:CR=1 FL=1
MVTEAPLAIVHRELDCKHARLENEHSSVNLLENDCAAVPRVRGRTSDRRAAKSLAEAVNSRSSSQSASVLQLAHMMVPCGLLIAPESKIKLAALSVSAAPYAIRSVADNLLAACRQY